MPVSPALKPEPVTVTELSGAPLVGRMEMPELVVKDVVTAEVTAPYAPIV